MSRFPRITSATKCRGSLRRRLFWEAYLLLTVAVIGVVVPAWLLIWWTQRTAVEAMLRRDAALFSERIEASMSHDREALATLSREALFAAMPSVRGVAEYMSDGTLVWQWGDAPHTRFVRRMLRQEQTFTEGVLSEDGWSVTVIGVPIRGSGFRIGILDATSLQDLSGNEVSEYGAKHRIVLRGKEGVILLRQTTKGEHLSPAVLPIDDPRIPEMLQALGGSVGAVRIAEEEGVSTFAAYQPLPSLGWAAGIAIPRSSALASALHITLLLWGIGFTLAFLLSLSALLLARRIVWPLEMIVRKLDAYEKRRGMYHRSITTGDELEAVDASAAALTERVSVAHDHLEEIVKQRTVALREQLSENRTILESIDDGIIVTDESGTCRYLNAAAMTMLTTSSEDIVGKDAVSVMCLHTNDGVTVSHDDHPINRVLKMKKAFHPTVHSELSLLRSDASEIAVHLSVIPMMRGASCLGAVVVLRDTTEERRIDRMKSEFISLVSHQLRTPLSSMRWYLEILLAEDATPSLAPEQRESLTEIAASNTRMVHLVDGLLNVSRMEMGQVHVTPERLDVMTLMKDVTTSFQLELRQKSMRVDIDDGACQECALCTDASLLKLVIENLLSNAIKYSTNGSTVSIRLSYDATQDVLTIAITDTGIGIPDAQRAMVGHRLFRGKNAILSSPDGNGLGLYISMIAAEAIGGSITFESKEGEGTTFLLTVRGGRKACDTEKSEA